MKILKLKKTAFILCSDHSFMVCKLNPANSGGLNFRQFTPDDMGQFVCCILHLAYAMFHFIYSMF